MGENRNVAISTSVKGRMRNQTEDAKKVIPKFIY